MATKRQAEYTGIPVKPPSFLGGMSFDEQAQAGKIASEKKGYDPDASPQIKMQQALQRHDMNALSQTLETNPQLLKGNPVAMEQLRKGLSKDDKQELLTKLGQTEGSAPLTQERQDLIAQVKGVEPQRVEQTAAHHPRLEGQRVQTQRHNTI